MSYSMIIFTPWVDVDAKYETGYLVLYFTFIIGAINTSTIIYELCKFLRRMSNKEKYTKQWTDYKEQKSMLADKLIE